MEHHDGSLLIMALVSSRSRCGSGASPSRSAAASWRRGARIRRRDLAGHRDLARCGRHGQRAKIGAYAVGVALGVLLGCVIDRRVAAGQVSVRVFAPKRPHLVPTLRRPRLAGHRDGR